jgi:hypothetical protein
LNGFGAQERGMRFEESYVVQEMFVEDLAAIEGTSADSAERAAAGDGKEQVMQSNVTEIGR